MKTKMPDAICMSIYCEGITYSDCYYLGDGIVQLVGTVQAETYSCSSQTLNKDGEVE